MSMLKTLLSSKKFIAAAIGVLVALVAKLGIELDTRDVLAIISPILAYVLGQGIADHGKERVKIIVNSIAQTFDDDVDESVDDAIDVELRP